MIGVRIQIRCFGRVRELVGRKRIDVTVPGGATVATALDELSTEAPGFTVDDGVGRSTFVMVNGTHASAIDGLETPLADGDVVVISDHPVPE